MFLSAVLTLSEDSTGHTVSSITVSSSLEHSRYVTVANLTNSIPKGMSDFIFML